jgi:diguanylate cyclase (GGDEF)-like protein
VPAARFVAKVEVVRVISRGSEQRPEALSSGHRIAASNAGPPLPDLFDSLREVDSLLARRRFGRAAELLRAASESRPDDLGLKLRLADALALDGRKAEAATLLEQVAIGFADRGFNAKAIAVLKKLQRVAPDFARVEAKVADRLSGERSPSGLVAEPASPRPPAAATVAPDAPGDAAAPAEAIVRSPLFAAFNRAELIEVIRGLRLHAWEAGQVLVSEGEPGGSLFVIASGSARVHVEGPDRRHREVRRLEAGDFFGEISLLSGAPRSATVIAAAPCEVLELDRATVAAIATREPSVRATIERFCLERSGSREERDARGSLFRPSPELESGEFELPADAPAPSLEPGAIAALVPFCTVIARAAGEPVFARGDAGDCLYVVDEGEVELRFEQRRPVKRLGPGEVFGELALVSPGRRRTAGAVAATPCRLIAIDRAAWRRLTAERPDLIVGLLERSCAYLVESEQRLVADLRRHNKELERALDFLQRTRQELSTAETAALTDPLTGLYNRRCFDEQLPARVARAGAGGLAVALLLVDLDQFKEVNDRHGHPVGDLALRRFGALLAGAVRWSDLPCRVGGDEFAVVWTDLDPRAAARRARELRSLLGAFDLPGSPTRLALTSSLGGAVLAPGEDAAALVARADRGLYLAKRSGRGRLAWNEHLVDEPAAIA